MKKKSSVINLNSNMIHAMAQALGWQVDSPYSTSKGAVYMLISPQGRVYNQGYPIWKGQVFQPRRSEQEAWDDLPKDI